MSIDFTKVVAITTLEGSVQTITCNTDGKIIWNGTQTISTVPSVSDTYTYTGSTITPIWSNYNSDQLTIGGTYSATNAGTYSATFTPKIGYQWSDGTTIAKTAKWTIEKAAGSLSINPTSITFNSSTGLVKTIAVTRAGDGEITAKCNNTDICTVDVSGTTVNVNAKKSQGTATVTIAVAAGTNHTSPSNKTCKITTSFTASYELKRGSTSLYRIPLTDSLYIYTNMYINNGQLVGDNQQYVTAQEYANILSKGWDDNNYSHLYITYNGTNYYVDVVNSLNTNGCLVLYLSPLSVITVYN